tara:strand:- start:675 stop:1466 length:792 start_codon:yes stop_codon:yes gene_type:complete
VEKYSLPAPDRIKAAITPDLHGLVWRVVESQEQVATLDLVETLEEQALLEKLLERSKPPLPDGCLGLDYLLATPFRYPPLKWGSRFGSPYEPSLFYGAAQIPTALAETAYYRVVFWTGMATPPPSGALKTQHTVFSVPYRCAAGLSLNAAPFEECQDLLRHPTDYSATQYLGARLRTLGVDGFTFTSARCPDRGLNIALFTPAALAAKQPREKQTWLCETSARHVMFSGPGPEQGQGQGQLLKFDGEDFRIAAEAVPASPPPQ